MHIEKIETEKKRHLDLLLLADEQEDMIDRYLERGDMYALHTEGQVVGTCVVTREPGGVIEIKNIATRPGWQGKGYGRALIDHVAKTYHGQGATLQVGTGNCPSTLGFYHRCGFIYSHTIANFFTDNYHQPIFEGGKQLVDMIVLQKPL